MLINEESKPLASCVVCHCEKTVRGIFSHFAKEHTESSAAQKEKAIIARHANNAVYIAAGEKRKSENKAVYDIAPKVCLQCNINIPYDKRQNNFCSKTCSCTYNNLRVSLESRQRRGKTTSNTMSDKRRKGLLQKVCRISFCASCGTLIRNSIRNTCSPECLTVRKIKMGTKAGLASVKKMQGSRRSNAEIQLFDLCSEEYSNITANDTSIANGWDADILLHDYKIVIMWNGPWHYRDMPGLQNHSLSQVQNRDRIKIKEFNSVGWKVLVFEDRHYTPQTAFESIKKTINGVTGGS